MGKYWTSTKNIMASTRRISSNMNRKAINAMAIRSRQEENEGFAGGTNKSLDGTRVLKSGSEDVP
jgi:hypothetical protein